MDKRSANVKTSVIKELLENKGLTFKLARNDLKNRFAGSYLGTIWAFVQPIVTILCSGLYLRKASTQGRRA